MLKEWKSWFTKNEVDPGVTYNFQAQLMDAHIGMVCDYLVKDLHEKIADKWLEENKDVVTKMILKDPHFADKVYNAIILKKAQQLL